MATVNPIKVLCLHGFCQTGPVFSSKSSGLRKMLKKFKIETYYPTGPTVLKPEDLPFDVKSLDADKEDSDKGNEFISWWYNVDDFDIEPALASIRSYIAEYGPFDGIMGFSQGAALAQLITNSMEQLGNTKPVQFGIYFSGYVTKNTPINEKYLSKKVSIPTLHITGEQDTVVSIDRSLEFAEKYCEPGTATIFKHPGGHYVPNQKPLVKQWTEWVLHIVKPEGDAEEEKPKKQQSKQKKSNKQQALKKEEPKKELTKEEIAKKEADELEELGKGIDNLGTA